MGTGNERANLCTNTIRDLCHGAVHELQTRTRSRSRNGLYKHGAKEQFLVQASLQAKSLQIATKSSR